MSAAVYFTAAILPGIYLKNRLTAVTVGVVYGIIDIILYKILFFLSLPFIFFTFGLFILMINTFMLWLTDKLLEDFEVKNLATTFLASTMISVTSGILHWIF